MPLGSCCPFCAVYTREGLVCVHTDLLQCMHSQKEIWNFMNLWNGIQGYSTMCKNRRKEEKGEKKTCSGIKITQ